MTKAEIINQALVTARRSEVPEAQQNQYDTIYSLILGDLLEERKWLFTLDITNNLTPTAEGPDLGYRYKYALPAGAVGVLGPYDGNFTSYLSIEEALRAGLAVDGTTPQINRNQEDYIFINGVLHSNTEITRIVYEREVTPDQMPDSFRLLLIYALAEYIAETLGRDSELSARLRTRKEKQHRRATREEMNAPRDPYLLTIYTWLRQYYTASRRF